MVGLVGAESRVRPGISCEEVPSFEPVGSVQLKKSLGKLRVKSTEELKRKLDFSAPGAFMKWAEPQRPVGPATCRII